MPRALDADKVVGGPGWLDFDRFDVIGKAPGRVSIEGVKPMLQALLADRFKLVLKAESRPLPAMALVAGKKPTLKESDGSDASGCKLQSSGGSGPGSMTIRMNGTELTLGPGAMVGYACRNMTMAAFADGMRSMVFADVGGNRVVDQTGLAGAWNFDFKFSLPLRLPGGEPADPVTFKDAIQKQLGLELTPTKIPFPVYVVESASESPTPNPPGVAEALPPLPEEFEVADVKPTAPDFRGGKFEVLPSGRVTLQGQTLRNLIARAWGLSPIANDETLIGPKFIDSARFDIVAKAATYGPPPDAPASTPNAPAPQFTDPDSIDPMLRTLLAQRFALTFHMEERPINSYVLKAVKPKLQKADPSHRTSFHEGPGADGKDPRTANPAIGRLVTVENMTMAQFAASIPRIAAGYFLNGNAVVSDGTGLVGAWDFTLSFSGAGAVNGPGGGGVRGGGDAAGPAAPDPGGISLFEAIEKQLGLKLEQTKRPAQIMVIDHIEEKPKEP